MLAEGAATQVKRYPLEGTEGVGLHNVAAEPATHPGQERAAADDLGGRRPAGSQA